ncbi:nitrogenase [Cylindrospermopsis raciborskii CENA303]|uniref:Nitrogenase n=1 Tax=Cylindrospermopsis raciborskii CENA303 TaxID=1170769 RepID=A0A1X4G4D0_9CYAN|nr:Mo-dependent nitrogenase C-terminal domain-containing protein [Cylindrospermopsis raciborskii]EFA72150.1 Mo-dependent nitrogenase-like protein [Raphidiopsis brookii D9]OSO89395.1 nitrogenase [Cylindrospermopsis raciborskii CENA303]
MKVFENTTKRIFLTSWVSPHQMEANHHSGSVVKEEQHSQSGWDVLRPVRNWLDNIKVQDRDFAHMLCKLIPAQCPFERDVKLLGKVLFHIPPLCKLNPFYDQLAYLRFRALCYLADECGEA